MGVSKNGHARYPKDYIKSALHGRAAGTQVVLTATVDGMCTIDAMMMFKHFKSRLEELRTTTLTFTAILANQLLDNKWNDCASETSLNVTPVVMPPPPLRRSGNSEVWHGTQTAQASFQTHVGGLVCALVKIEDEDNRRDGDKRRGCHVCWDLEKNNRKSQWVCARLQKGVCGPGTGSKSGTACEGLRVNIAKGVIAWGRR